MFYACLYIDCGLPPGGSPLNIQRYLRPSPDPPGACLAYSFSSQSPLSRIQPQTHPKRKRYRIPKNIYASLIPSSINKKCYPTFSPNSFNCLESTCVGASVKRQLPFCVFGKAIVSRMDSNPVKIATSRSMPKATPACGGAPYSNALKINPNLFSASWEVKPIISNIFFCISFL